MSRKRQWRAPVPAGSGPVLSIEQEFGLTIPDDEVARLLTLRDLATYISARMPQAA